MVKKDNSDSSVYTWFPQALEIIENLENHLNIPCMEKSWNFVKDFDETQGARNLVSDS